MKTACAILLIVAATFASPAMARSERAHSRSTLTLTGQGKIEVKPDFARVAVSVSTKAKTLADAARQHQDEASRARSLLQGLKNDGVSIERADFTLAQDRPPVIAPGDVKAAVASPKFTARTAFLLKIKPVNELDSALSALAGSGLLRVGSVTFGVDHPGAAMNRARRAAMIDARRQADVYADAGEFRLGSIKRVSNGRVFSIQGQADLPMRAQFAPASVQIVPPAVLAFSSAVTVAWRIAPR